MGISLFKNICQQFPHKCIWKIKYQYILGKKGYKETNVFQKYSY